MTPEFDNFTEKVLLQEITINLDNSFKWYVATPKELKSFGINPKVFQKVFYFQILDYVYIVTFEDNGELHFWNHNAVVANPIDDNILHMKLKLFDASNTLKIVSTLFSIMKYLTQKEGIRKLIIISPDNEELAQRFNIYKKLIENNYKTFLPNFDLTVDGYKIVLKRELSITEQHKSFSIKKAYIKSILL